MADNVGGAIINLGNLGLPTSRASWSLRTTTALAPCADGIARRPTPSCVQPGFGLPHSTRALTVTHTLRLRLAT